MVSVLAAVLLAAGDGSQAKLEATPEWKKAQESEATAEKSGRFADWSDAGECWLIAAKKFRQPQLQDRGLECLSHAWEKAEGGDRDLLRVRLSRVAQPPADYAKAPKGSVKLAGWWPASDDFGASVDPRFFRSGKASVKFLPAKASPGNPDGWSSMESLAVPVVPGKEYVCTAWVFAFENDGESTFTAFFRSGDKQRVQDKVERVPVDRPMWRKVEVRGVAPSNATLLSVRLDSKFTKGAVWLDDVSVVEAGQTKELLTNGSLEGK